MSLAQRARSWLARPGTRHLARPAAEIYFTVLRLLGLARPTGELWHRRGVGADWDGVGKHQFDVLLSQGLSPQHRLLDIGCGSFRGGVHFIEYLDTGHYYGIEKEPSLLEAGRDLELTPRGLLDKKPHLHVIDDFDLDSVGNDLLFDFMLAKSVFTHLVPEDIELCLRRVMPRLRSDGTFLATYNASLDGRIDLGVSHRWRKKERGVTHYPRAWFEELADRLGLRVTPVGARGRSSVGRFQRWLAFTHRNLEKHR